MDISVIVPVYNGAKRIPVCLEALMRQTLPREKYEVLIVDNGSTDDTAEVLGAYHGKSRGLIRYIDETERGVCAARNRGITEARGKYLAFTDDDCAPEPGWLEAVLQAFETSDAEAVQGKVVLATPIPEGTKYPLDFIHKRIAHVDYYPEFCKMRNKDLVGANVSFLKEVFEKFGNFNGSPDYYLCEDTELSTRMMRKGIKAYYQPKAVVHHHFDAARLNDEFFLRQSRAWGRANILLEPAGLPTWRHFLYCLRLLAMEYFLLASQQLQKKETDAFLTRCRVYGYLGRCEQLLKGRKKV